MRELIHDKKISIEGIKKLFDYAACWEIRSCSEERKSKCLAYRDRAKPVGNLINPENTFTNEKKRAYNFWVK